MWKLLEQFLTRETFGEWFCISLAFMRFHRCSWLSYSVSPSTLLQLPLRDPTKTMIIWCLTKQIKTPKKVGIFLEKYPWWSPVLINSQDSIIDAGHRNWHFPWTFFQKTQPVEHTEVVYLMEKLCCIVFQNTYERIVTLEIARRKCAGKNPFQ